MATNPKEIEQVEAARVRARRGNLLGDARGEADSKMLKDAFIATASYEALVHRTDYNFVVGRRGAGKSALFEKISEHLRSQQGITLIQERPEDLDAFAFQETLKKVAPDYRTARIITRLTWKGQILTAALRSLREHYRTRKLREAAFLDEYFARHRDVFDRKGTARSVYLLRQTLKAGVATDELPRAIVDQYDINRLQSIVEECLKEIGLRLVFLYDGLDEGWIPTPGATAVLGGLAKAAADFADHESNIHCILFVRDNMLRALAHYDGDFARHIEGNIMRLHWDENSLLSLVAARLRAALGVARENDIKVWNRFAQRELKDREGFRKCLQYTLYRPRDLIVLLNKAVAVAASGNRDTIVETDVEATAIEISQTRLLDLYKEYDEVLPGLRHFVSLFKGRIAADSFGNILSLLDEALARVDNSEIGERDFALLGSGQEIFSALYSVGFIGVADTGSGRFVFCHDGSNSSLSTIERTRKVIVHPCYWKALEIRSDVAAEAVLGEVDDEQDERRVGPTVETEVQDLRLKRLGQIVEELPRIKVGLDDTKRLETWVRNALQVLFSGSLSNVEVQRSEGSLTQCRIMATNIAERGFWKRVLDNYKSRQVLVEISNDVEVTEDALGKAALSLSDNFGSLLLFVTRNPSEGLTDLERRWVKELWNQQRKMVLIVPAHMLARAQSKLRAKKKRVDYADELLDKRLDTFERDYVNASTRRR
jgi:hypothetical protein